ncbi:MAG: site-2 protease family protein [Acidimicrobiales bacterium]
MRTSLGWGTVTVASLVALGLLAPSGLALLAFLAAVIGIHEGGHFVAARRRGILASEFYWGFGPEVFSVVRGRTRYGVRAAFIGGYVNLPGMTPSSTRPDGVGEEETYRAARPRARLVTVVAGPAANLVTAVAAFAVARWLEGGSWWGAAVGGAGDVVAVATETLRALGVWITHLWSYLAAVLDSSGATTAPVQFMSPVAQAQVSARAVELGPVAVLRWFAILSSAVGLVNLLPLPPLDGGHAVAAVADGMVGRFVPHRRRGPLDLTRLAPLAYVTVAGLLVISAGALVLDLRALG